MTHRFGRVAAVSFVGILLGGSLSAGASAAIINFEQNGAALPGGSLSYAGNGGVAFGSGIAFDQLSLAQANPPAGNQGALACQGCSLTFNTGLNTLEGPSLWTFNDIASSFSITGNVFAEDVGGNAIGNPIVSGTLLSGFFNGPQYVIGIDLTPGVSGGSVLQFTGSGSSTQNASNLLQYFGLDPNAELGFASSLSSFAGDTMFGADGSFSGSITSADVNASVIANGSNNPSNEVAEPAQLGLFGLALALIGFLGLGRRDHQLPENI